MKPRKFKGWRLLKPDEVLRKGDRFSMYITDIGKKFKSPLNMEPVDGIAGWRASDIYGSCYRME